MTSGIGALEISSPYAASAKANPKEVVCSYCQKVGHTSYRCNTKKRDKKKALGGGGSSISSSMTTKSPGEKWSAQDEGNRRSGGKNQGNTTPAMKPRSTGAQGAPPREVYCDIHDSYTHSIRDCFTVAKKRRELQENRNQRPGGASSGEGARPRRHEPP